MENEEVVPQFNDYVEVFDGPDGQIMAVTVQIEGIFPFVTAAQALAYINGDGDEDDHPEDDEDDTDKLQMGRVVAEHVYEQILSWHQFTGTWLGIGDEVEHLDPEGGVFRIVGRLFGLYPRRIGFTVQYRAIDWTHLPE